MNLLAAHEGDDDVPKDVIPEAVADLIAETFSEPEPEKVAISNSEDESGDYIEEISTEEDRLTIAKDQLGGLKAARVRAKQALMDMENAIEASRWGHQREIDAISEQWSGTKGNLRIHLKPIKVWPQGCIEDVLKRHSF